MSQHFDAEQGLIVIPVELVGPSGTAIIRLALDTGATCTLVNAGLLVAVGYDPALDRERTQVTTGSGVEYVPRVKVSRITALGVARDDLVVLCHTLPPSAAVDGLLGLDFVRARKLTIDFTLARVDLE